MADTPHLYTKRAIATPLECRCIQMLIALHRALLLASTMQMPRAKPNATPTKTIRVVPILVSATAAGRSNFIATATRVLIQTNHCKLHSPPLHCLALSLPGYKINKPVKSLEPTHQTLGCRDELPTIHPLISAATHPCGATAAENDCSCL